MSKDILKISKDSNVYFNLIEDYFVTHTHAPHIIAGPCCIENEEVLDATAKGLYELGIRFLRAGVFKPRTSPYDFQGIGIKGLEILKEVGLRYAMFTVSEIVDVRHLETMIDNVDLLQIGSRNMQNFELLKEVGRSGHPVLLKRGMGASVEEFKMAAEYMACEGNRHIIMCERGIRTFETATRNTLDIACPAILKRETKLPVVVDLSHSLGRKDILPDVAKAVVAMGIDGLMVEVHSDVQNALSDNSQQLSLDEFEKFLDAIDMLEERLV